MGNKATPLLHRQPQQETCPALANGKPCRQPLPCPWLSAWPGGANLDGIKKDKDTKGLPPSS